MIFKLFLAVLMFVHGFMHLLCGFSELKIAQFNNLSGKILFPVNGGLRKILGAVWLWVAAMFFISAGLLFFNQALFLAICALVLSQVLIIVWWPDAKWGTAVNFLIVAGLFLIWQK